MHKQPMKELIGTGVALVTPMLENGNLDLDGLDRLVESQINGGIDYLVVLGTTGESVTLTKEEKASVIDRVVAINAGRLPLVLGIGGNDTQQVVSQLQNMNQAPFCAVLSVSPSYNKPTQEGIYQHFKQVVDASPLPVILYNVPGRTASNMLPETVARLARDFEKVVAIKEAAGDLVQAMELVRLCPDDFMIISGDDMIALPMTLAGGSGVISVVAAAVPQAFSKMIRMGLLGLPKEAFTIQYQLAPFIDMAFEEGNPAGIKAALKQRGICTDAVRLPLVKAGADLQGRIAAFLEQPV